MKYLKFYNNNHRKSFKKKDNFANMIENLKCNAAPFLLHWV